MLVPTSRTDKSSKKALKMSLINNAVETTRSSPRSPSSKSDNNQEDFLSPITVSPQTISPQTSPTTNTQNLTSPSTNAPNNNTNINEFKRTLSSPYIECIAPNQKGNFITCIEIDELNGWLLAGQCSGTLNAWKIPTIEKQKNKKNIYECRNLILCEEDGIRHIFSFENNIVCMVGYRRICSFINYDKSTINHWKLGINDIFTYSPFTSPHMFYSTQFENIIHIFCRSFSSLCRIDLKTHKKQTMQLAQKNRITPKTNILTVNKNFVIWQTLKTKYNFYVKAENLHKNKQEKQLTNNKNEDNKLKKWLNEYRTKKRRYVQPTLLKIEVRSLSSFNPIHDLDYFEPLSFKCSHFYMDNISTNMAFVTKLNVIKILQIVPDFNIMQYGCEYHKNIKNKINKSNTGKTIKNKNKGKTNSFVDALTLSHGLSYDASIETQSGDHDPNQGIDFMQNDDEQDQNVQNNNINMNMNMNMNINPSQGTNSGGNENDKQVKELYSLRGHNGYILAIEYIDGIILSMATDRKLNVWNGKNGKNIATISNIPGRFIPGYPYIIKKAKNSNKVFYTADDGIFMVVF